MKLEKGEEQNPNLTMGHPALGRLLRTAPGQSRPDNEHGVSVLRRVLA